eukprot:GHRR01004181.1.p1 GENE.GHRR01004181.1~~GHRR01004181.1.p1  ORF type:complete len:170 (+),score=39.89 GHRR01004181.1:166-675(+)
MAAVPFRNDGTFLEYFEQFQELSKATSAAAQPNQAAKTEDPPSSSSRNDIPATSSGQQPARYDSDSTDFLPATSFTGAKQGYMFTAGDKGLGYYKDNPLHLKHKAQSKAKPVALRTNNSIVKGLRRRGAAPPESKKRKTESESSYLKEMERYRSMACSADTKHDRPLVK